MNEIIKSVDLYLKENEGGTLDVWNGHTWVGLELLDTYGVIMQDNVILSCVSVTDGTKKKDININIVNIWDNAYHDELIEIQDLIGYQVGQSFYNWTLVDEVKKLAIDNEITLSDIAYNGCWSGVVSELVYNSDIEFFYNRFKKEIDDLVTSHELYLKVWKSVEKVALESKEG